MKVVFLSPDFTEVITLRAEYSPEYLEDDLHNILLDFSRIQKIEYIVSEVVERFGAWKILLATESVQGTNYYHATRFNNPKTIKELAEEYYVSQKS